MQAGVMSRYSLLEGRIRGSMADCRRGTDAGTIHALAQAIAAMAQRASRPHEEGAQR